MLIVVDTPRSDRLSAYGYDKSTTPHIDELAAEGAVFLNHYSQSWHTRASMQSLFYSRYFVKSILPCSTRVTAESASEPFQRLDSERSHYR